MAVNTYTISATFYGGYTNGKGPSNWSSIFNGGFTTSTNVYVGRDNDQDWNHYGVYQFTGTVLDNLIGKVNNGDATIEDIELRFYSDYNITGAYALAIGEKESSATGSTTDRSTIIADTRHTMEELGLPSIAAGWNRVSLLNLNTDLNAYKKGVTLGAASNYLLGDRMYTFGVNDSRGDRTAQLIIKMREDYVDIGTITVSNSDLISYYIRSSRYVDMPSDTSSQAVYGTVSGTEAGAISNARDYVMSYSTSNFTEYGVNNEKYLNYHKDVTETKRNVIQAGEGAGGGAGYFCEIDGYAHAYKDQLYIPFNVPSSVASSGVSAVTLTLTPSSTSYTTYDMYVCAPATSSSDIIQYTENTSSVFYSEKILVPSIKIRGATYQIDITNLFNHCLEVGQYWLVITPADETQNTDNYLDINTDITIKYVAAGSAQRIWHKVNGIWKKCIPWVKVNNVWKPCSSSWVKINGVWKPITSDGTDPKTIILNSTSMTGGYRSGWGSTSWQSYSPYYVSSHMQCRVGGENNTYYATNILFDPNELNSLRSKNIKSIELELSGCYGSFMASTSTWHQIGYKYNDDTGLEAGSSDAWARSDVNSSAIASTTIAYMRGTDTSNIGANDQTLQIDLPTDIPQYGYTIGPESSSVNVWGQLKPNARLIVKLN